MTNAIVTVEFLTEDEVKELIQVRHASRQFFRVGDIAQAALDRVEKKKLDIHKFLVLSFIGEISGINPRRVEKYRMVAERFTPAKREKYLGMDIPFTYFESAFDFSSTGEEMKFLDFVAFWLEEKGRWPGVDTASLLFRTHALGQDVSPIDAVHRAIQPRTTPQVLEYSPAEPEFPAHAAQSAQGIVSPAVFVPKERLRRMIADWKSKGDSLTTAACIEELERLL